MVDVLQKGDLFGELKLDQAQGTAEFMKVVSDEAIICTFFRERLEEVMLRKPDFALNYIKFMGFNYKKNPEQLPQYAVQRCPYPFVVAVAGHG